MQVSIVFLVRVQCRRKESSRSLSHLLVSFLFLKSAVGLHHRYSVVKPFKLPVIHQVLRDRRGFTLGQRGAIVPKPELFPQSLLTTAVCSSKTSKQLYRERF